MERKKGISRRTFLKALGIGTGIVASHQILEYGIDVYRQKVIESRRARLPSNLIQNLPQNQVAIGFSPDKNITANAMTIANKLQTFPQCINFFFNTLDSQTFNEVKLGIQKGIIPVISCGNPKEIIPEMEKFEFPYIIRPFFEINGDWTKAWWGDITPKEFVSNWKKMYTETKNSSKNALLALCLNSSIYIDPSDPNHFDKWFPGEEYIDLFALDIYNKHSENTFQPEHYIPDYSPEIMIGPDILAMNKLAPNTPKIVTEINCLKENKATWLKEAVSYLPKVGVKLWMSFDWDKTGFGETKWNPLHYPALIRAYTEEFQKPYYISTNTSLQGKPKITIDKILSKNSKVI